MPEAPLMLGVSGLRGIVGKSLTPEVAARFAAAFGAWLRDAALPAKASGWPGVAPGQPLVIVGADGRTGYEPIRDSVIAGLWRSGCHVVNVGIAMTPTVGVETDHSDAHGAVIVTASHNPQEWNGLKCLVRTSAGQGEVSASAPTASMAQQIIQRFHELRDRPVPAPDPAGTLPYAEAEDADGEHWGAAAARAASCAGRQGLEDIRARRFKTVLDSVGGAGRVATPIMLGHLGCGVHHLGANTDGLFQHTPEPTRENLTNLCAAVRQHRADIGFAQDPDADRLAIIDERGEYIGEEYTLVLAAEALLSTRPKIKAAVLVTNLSTSRMLDDIAAKYGARVVRTPVGEANVVEAMKREKAAGHDVVLGGEGNGGVIWPKVTYVRDSLSAMALTLALMARTGKKVSELVASIPAYAIEKRKVDIPSKDAAQPAVDRLAAHYSRRPATRIDLQDGVRVDLDDRKAWLHVRPSNTEPIMRLIAEAPTAAEAKAILNEAARIAQGA